MRKTRLPRRNEKRRAESFERNFLSGDYVDYTRHQPCLFCGSIDRVRTAHVLEGRKMGGRGGDWKATGPVCFGCDKEWAAGVKTFLRERGLTMEDLAERVALHHTRYAHHLIQW